MFITYPYRFVIAPSPVFGKPFWGACGRLKWRKARRRAPFTSRHEGRCAWRVSVARLLRQSAVGQKGKRRAVLACKRGDAPSNADRENRPCRHCRLTLEEALGEGTPFLRLTVLLFGAALRRGVFRLMDRSALAPSRDKH